MLAQGASFIQTCTAPLAMKSISPQILGSSDFEISAYRETHNHHEHNSSYGSIVDVASGKFFPHKEEHTVPHCSGNLSCLKDCNLEAEENPALERDESLKVKQVCGIDRGECVQVKHDDSIDKEECALCMQVKVTQDEAFDIACGEHECETTRVDDDNRTSKVHVDVNACSSHMDKLSVNASEAHAFHEGQEELNSLNKDIQSVSPPTQTVNDDLSHLSNEKGSEEQTPPPRKPAWRTPEAKARVSLESEFIMEASSWPTLAEARHAKPSEARISPSHKETISFSSPAQKESAVEVPKNPPKPVSNYRSSYKKGSGPSYGKPSFPATENIPIPPMGVHVASANVFNVDQSRKIVGVNNFFPGPHQVPTNGPFYHHRGEGLAPFPHNSVPPYGRGHPGWQHHGRGYSDASYKHSGFLPRYDQQHIGPRNMHPPMAPFMNINVAQYNYPNFPADMSYMPTPGYNYAPPYFGPSGPPGGVTQGFDLPTLLAMLQSQIEYYFSKENLIRDIFLTSKMDEEGFVPLSLIASFPRVRNLTLNSMHILEALKNSSVVEVKNGKLRSHEWRRRLSGSSQTHGIESLEPLSNRGVDHAREQGTGPSEEFGEGGFGKMSTLPENRLIAGSCTAPWTGLSANLGAINVPAVTSIDSR